ncbi:MAG: hypothetical protein JWO51_848 [Rhodospirillales bacterium]|jgi:hypothetical protein|nr:hypothetical protein [Rhodospirillales bacterium]
MADELPWQIDTERPMAIRAERLTVEEYELVAVQIAADGAWPEEIRWEIFGPPNNEAPIATGRADTFVRAKTEAVRAWRSLAEGRTAQKLPFT